MTRVPSYEQEPYLTRLEVEVVSIGESEGRPFAILDDTILFPEGGGQPADHGRLGEATVIDVQKKDGEIRHFLEAPCERGSTLLALDWRRRYDHMQQHTAQHLFSALALERFGWATRSFHLGPKTSDIELDAPALSEEDLEALENAVVAAILEGHPIETRRVSPDEYAQLNVRSRGLPEGHTGDLRLVEIEGIDLNTCGGTHLRSTREIETVKIVRVERLRGGHRVHWIAGGRIRHRLAAHEARNFELRTLFDADDDSLVELATLKLDQLGGARRRIRQLETELAQVRVENLVASEDQILVEHFDEADGGFLQQIARALLERAPAKTSLLTATGEKGSFFLLAAGTESPLEAGQVGPKIAELLEGRGGGSGQIFQGKAGSLSGRAESEALLRNTARSSGPRTAHPAS